MKAMEYLRFRNGSNSVQGFRATSMCWEFVLKRSLEEVDEKPDQQLNWIWKNTKYINASQENPIPVLMRELRPKLG